MKVVFITTVSNTIKSFLLPYANELKLLGHKVDAIAKGVNEDDEIKLYFDEVHDINISRNIFEALFSLPFAFIKLREHLKYYDVIHCHTPIASFIARMAIATISRKRRPIVIYTAHGFHFHPEGNKILNVIYYMIERFAARFTDYLITINKYDYEKAKSFKVKKRVIHIEGIGVNSETYSEQNINNNVLHSLKKRIFENEAYSEFVFSIIAEFTPNKNQTIVIDAARYLINFPFKLVFAGDGRKLEKVKKYARKKGVSNKCIFLGFEKNIKELLGLTDCLLLPSKREGLPRVIMEAMSMGIPIIGSDIRGIRDLLNYDGSFLFNANDSRELAQIMKYVMMNVDEIRRKARIGRDIVEEKYDLKIILPKYMELYKEIEKDLGETG